MTRRNVAQRLLSEGRGQLSAVGDDEGVMAWAVEASATSAEFKAVLAQAPLTLEYQTLRALVGADRLSYPTAVQAIRKHVEGLHGRLLDAPFSDEEIPAIEREGTQLLRWQIACDHLLLEGTDNAEETLARLDDPAFQRLGAIKIADDVIRSGESTDKGVAQPLRAFFAALIDGDSPSIEALRPHLDPASRGAVQRPEVFDQIIEALEDRFLMTGGYRRALLSLPAVVNYLGTTGRRASMALANDDRRSLEIERLDVDGASTMSAEDAAAARQDAIDAADLIVAIEREFLPSLPRRIREDFVAVRLRRERAVDVATRTGRSRAAVSQNLARASELFEAFRATRG